VKLANKKTIIVIIAVLIVAAVGALVLVNQGEEDAQQSQSQTSSALDGPKVSLRTDENTLVTARPYLVSDAKIGVIIIHDLQKDRSETMQFAEELAKTCKCSTIALDLRGHGQSQGVPDDYQKMYYDALVAQKYLEAQDAMDFYYIGFGFGAHVALHASAKAKAAGVVMVSPSIDDRGEKSDRLIEGYKGRVLTAAAKTDPDPNSMATKLFNLAQVQDRQFAEYERGGNGIEMVYNTDLGKLIKDWIVKSN
jgi:pimeloyl-ACP methyl ester carboxylesterase